LNFEEDLMKTYTDFDRAVEACYHANTSTFEDWVIVAGPGDGEWTLMEEYDAIEAGFEGLRYR